MLITMNRVIIFLRILNHSELLRKVLDGNVTEMSFNPILPIRSVPRFHF